MPETKPVAVKDLVLDLGNYRTVRQSSEESALVAMVSTSPDRFWALTESLLRDGYLPTESIIVLRTGRSRGGLTVKEGNRRIAALKLIHGLLPAGTLDLPDSIAEQIRKLPKEWLVDNRRVPCTIYDAKDAATVDRIVTLAHGKGEKAGRDQWNAVARARHNRDASIAPRLGATSSPALARNYPAVKNRDALEAILHDIGIQRLGFDKIRQKETDFATAYGLPPKTKDSGASSSGTSKSSGAKGAGGTSTGKSQTQPKALAITDPKAVRRLLRDFTPRGKKREKVVALLEEALLLNVGKTPLAFCFVLRSMFEVSAKAYCADHASSSGLSTKNAAGQDKPLVEILRIVTTHLTKNRSDKEMVKALHGAMTELGKSEGLLSVTSMNQLVHNPRFSIAPSDIAILFGNVFPLLEAMNA